MTILDTPRVSGTLPARPRSNNGDPISPFDAMIAAIARSRGGSLATRNIKDFPGCGINLIDPWTAKVP